ncbi:uncharacterized protein LOC126470549 [Schistocerca serialis cubense]|uniref:uncharacterized protein LOC126185084 n=1 Tax=Schistocerca cancellata TaxID=274614 RepID=UPI00211943CF|nr:uncharacterized protein LOC126185084 [Schistocerca cancellata]XP_049954443.1 uncharacterized protein LOC126470549 [Schistocerca serialis cubense]
MFSTQKTVHHLPNEILEKIFSHLSVYELARAANVCRRWAELLQDTRLWKGKRYDVEEIEKKDDILLVAGVWPALIYLNLVKGDRFRMSLNVAGASVELPNLTDKTIHSIVGTLMTKTLSVDVRLLDEGLENCLAVQTQNLLRLSVTIPPGPLNRDMIKRTESSLKALAHTFSIGAVPSLRSLRISSESAADAKYDSCAGSEVILSLRSCPELKQLRISGCTCVSWKMVGRRDELRVLSVVHSKMKEFLIHEQCQNLRDITLEHCPFLKKIQFWAKHHSLNLQSLRICNTSINSEALEYVCKAAPGLDVLVIQSCPKITFTSFVRHCFNLQHFELSKWSPDEKYFYFDLALLPSGLRHLSMMNTTVREEHMDHILKRLPMLETLNLGGCVCISSVSFLEHCPELVDLNLSGLCQVPATSFSVLAELRKLRNLNLRNCSLSSNLLCGILQKMPNLKKLDLSCIQTIGDLFFVTKCHSLRCLNMSHCPRLSPDITELRQLTDVRTLRIYGVPGRPFITDLERDIHNN